MKVSSEEVDWEESGGDVRFRRKQLAAATDAEALGCSLYELPPGERSFPYHYHEANEEALYVLAGSGTVRLADGSESLAAGDYVALPPGEAGGHRVVNDGDEPLRYLAVSTMSDPDVVVYPEMDKIGVYTGTPPGRHEGRKMTKYFPEDGTVPYWPGEE